MSALVRLARTLHEEARRWGRVEGDLGGEPEVSPVGYLQPATRDGTVVPQQASFQISLFEPHLGHCRDYTVTITETPGERR